MLINAFVSICHVNVIIANKLIKNAFCRLKFYWCRNFGNKMEITIYIHGAVESMHSLHTNSIVSISWPTFNKNASLTVSNSYCWSSYTKNLNIWTFHFGNGHYGVINMKFFSHKFCWAFDWLLLMWFFLHSASQRKFSMPPNADRFNRTNKQKKRKRMNKKSIITVGTHAKGVIDIHRYAGQQ